MGLMGPEDTSAPEAVARVLEDFRRQIYTNFPAKVVRYNASDGTVDVDPAVKCEVPGMEHEPLLFEDLGELVNIPIQWQRAGGFVITFPIQVGDWVKVHCSIQSLLVWRGTGEVHSHPGISDPHGLNGCWAEPGCYPDVLRVRNVSTTDLVIGKEDGTAVIRMTPAGSVSVQTRPAQKLELNTTACEIGTGPAPKEGVTKDESLHRYLDLLFIALDAVIPGLTPLGAPVTPGWTAARQAAALLKSATASRVTTTQ